MEAGDLQPIFTLVERYGLDWGAAVWLFISRERLAAKFVAQTDELKAVLNRLADKLEGKEE